MRREHTERKQRQELGSEVINLAERGAQLGSCLSEKYHRQRARDGAQDARPSAQKQDQRKQEVDLPLNGDRPERPIGNPTADYVLKQEAVDNEAACDCASRETRLQDNPADDRGDDQCRPVRGQNPPSPATNEATGSTRERVSATH